MRTSILVGVLSVAAVALAGALIGPLAHQGIAAQVEVRSALDATPKDGRPGPETSPASTSPAAPPSAAPPSPPNAGSVHVHVPMGASENAASENAASENAGSAHVHVHTGASEKEPPADLHFIRSYRAPLAGGLLTFPPSFASADGRYNLVVHFNGNTDLVEESFGFAGLNAVAVILNLGVGSGLYEERFADPAAFQLLLDRVQGVMEQRGLRGARLDKLAVSAWSSGFGGVIRVLQSEKIADRIDAVVLFDALHCGYVQGTHTLKPEVIGPMVRFARRAAEGKALLSITHSKIVTYSYLNAEGTADVILDAARVPREPTTRGQPMPDLRSMVGVMPKALMVPLTAVSTARREGLVVRGYEGGGPITHMLHLVQMSTTALPDLAERWYEGREKGDAGH